MSHTKHVSHHIFDDEGILDIHQYCFCGNLPQLKVLLGRNSTINSRTVEKRRTPLHFAVAGGQMAVCEYLINNKALLNAKDSDGVTPIFFAASQNNLNLLTFLFGMGASLSVRTNHYLNLFHVSASLETHDSFGFLKYLAPYQALANQATRDGSTPLFFACKGGNLEILKALLNDFGVKHLNHHNQAGYTLLHVAAKFGHPGLVEFLLKLGVDPRKRTIKHETALMLAEGTASFGCISRLINRALRSWPCDEVDSMDVEGSSNDLCFSNSFPVSSAKRMKS